MEGDEFVPQEHEENLYSEASREDKMESDEISAGEEAFMKGYDEAEGAEDEKEEEEEEEKKEKEKEEKEKEKE